ncbi:MAG TPA: cache domain-containing protein, partial [Clostridia bacterium]|nr:cache domain-containing protein [Clostridia bacterium]
ASYIATKSGLVIMADINSQKKFADGSEKPAPYEAFTRPWYIKAKAEQKQVFTDVIYDVHGGGLAIVCAQPFFRNGEFMGVAGVGS